ncbi:hypothetical protein V499_06590 [Pseudogymnoascus sp. VKM F-103]|uniref:Glycosyl transferase family 28 C-terminal domain-containing protein n=1 Tax=Pseudogymnoascus verrucosus TaxID=342668 RepID=A0A1B8GMU1_9PEZI|nr:uncharacterized protein VE01_04843 [Pseudogymnoascus verrucosus]KFY73297.1 hypothetical protein V499_06590 [Pseudogymnoascus sp. VKM F-103]OBT97153.1 hypothetical protein VE01_04843 [Pseudogymnoascus verrucosus]
MSQVSPPLQIAVYIAAHGFGHFTRTLNLLSLLSHSKKYNFHIRTSSSLHTEPLAYALHPSIVQTNPYQLDAEQSLHSLANFDPSLPLAEETKFLKEHNIQAIIADAHSLPCLLAQTVGISSILITNFTFDSIFQAILDSDPTCTNKAALQLKIDEMTHQYALAHSVIRLPGHISFPFSGPQIIDAPMHSRKALQTRSETLAGLGLQCLESKKILLNCFGGHNSDSLSGVPKLPEGWACISQTIHSPPLFYKISHNVYMPDLIGACDVVLGKLGWGTCSEVIGNGYKPFIYVPRSAFIEEAGLLRWMESAHRRIVRLEVDEYESMDWRGAIGEAEKVVTSSSVSAKNWEKDDAELVRIFVDALEGALN